MSVNFYIMAGGSGTRFWPLSTADMPKQFLPIFNGKSLLQLTLERISYCFNEHNTHILTKGSFIPFILDNYPVNREMLIGEQYPRDTAATVAIATYHSLMKDKDSVCIILPSDHLIDTPLQFYNDIQLIVSNIDKYYGIFTIGIKPVYPSTSYGYLETEQKTTQGPLLKVLSFREKPDQNTALSYYNDAHYLWNSGIFIFKAQTMAEYIHEFLPGHVSIRDAFSSPRPAVKLSDCLFSLPKISFDYAIMEKADNIYTLPASFCWNDMGGWPAYSGFLQQDQSGNASNQNFKQIDSKGNIVYIKEKAEQIMLIGVNDLVIVQADNKTLIMHKDKTEELKKIKDIKG